MADPKTEEKPPEEMSEAEITEVLKGLVATGEAEEGPPTATGEPTYQLTAKGMEKGRELWERVMGSVPE